ncbi:MAG: hypothetical protein IKU41_06675 [Clostridia bacterium]|nr:hypothetical protein [Clostridia bacterium]
MRKGLKKLIAIVLTVTMAMSVAGPAFANVKNDVAAESRVNDLSKYGITNYAPNEIFGMEYVDEQGNKTVVTYTENKNENVYYNYYNGELTEVVKLYADNGYYQTFAVQDNNRNTMKATAKIEFETETLTEATSVSSRYADNGTKVRLGYVSYALNATDVFSVYCYYKQWVNENRTTIVPTTWTSLASCVAFFVGALKLPVVIVNEVITGFVAAGAMAILGETVKALVSTRIEATERVQEIYGQPVSTPGEPDVHIGDGSIYHVTDSESQYYGETFYEGYTSNDWRKPSFGSIILMIVYGLNVTPTSWSN